MNQKTARLLKQVAAHYKCSYRGLKREWNSYSHTNKTMLRVVYLHELSLAFRTGLDG